ncbi:MAG: F0F1 ATP synthase subunit delta, partial [Acidobacteriota bacterium]|nr:F0F1 ATP synthase subunit delta [Acidobacteriota bacterium]
MTNRAVAARYARALFEVSRDSGDVEKTEQDILLFQQLLNDHDTLRKVLFNPAISVLDKRGLVQAVLSKMLLSAVAERLLLMLADRDRLELLPEV